MGRLRGCLWLTAGLVIAIAAGVVAYITLTNAIVRDTGGEQVSVPRVGVVVTTHRLTVRSLVTAADVQIKEVPVDSAPEGALASVDDAVGKMVTTDLYSGEIIVVDRLINPTSIAGDGRTALIMAENEVLMAFPAGDLLSRIGILKPGDHVDILVTFSFPTINLAAVGGAETEQQKEVPVTFALLQNLTVAALVGGETANAEQNTDVLGAVGGAQPAQTTPKNPDAILLTVSPQDALVLKYIKDQGGVFDLTLRAPGVEQPFDTVPVDVQWIIDRYSITLANTGQ